MSLVIEAARQQRALMEQMADAMDDKTASMFVSMARRLRGNGALITAGTRINWNGALRKATVDLVDTFENTPDMAPALWEPVMYQDGVRIILDQELESNGGEDA